MKKVTAFIGTASKKATYQAVQEFEQQLKHYGDIDECPGLCKRLPPAALSGL
jgi:hypothetical protein